jgi:hypothetical protein
MKLRENASNNFLSLENIKKTSKISYMKISVLITLIIFLLVFFPPSKALAYAKSEAQGLKQTSVNQKLWRGIRSYNSEEILSSIAFGANLDKTSKEKRYEGETVFTYLIQKYKTNVSEREKIYNCIVILANNDAPIHKPNTKGKTPLEMARELTKALGSNKIEKALKDHGAKR